MAAASSLKRALSLHCGIKAAVGAVALCCVSCLNSREMFREEVRRSGWERKRAERPGLDDGGERVRADGQRN